MQNDEEQNIPPNDFQFIGLFSRSRFIRSFRRLVDLSNIFSVIFEFSFCFLTFTNSNDEPPSLFPHGTLFDWFGGITERHSSGLGCDFKEPRVFTQKFYSAVIEGENR
jgi:hypothetical protein